MSIGSRDYDMDDIPRARFVTFDEPDPDDTQIAWGQNTDPRGLLEVGKQYEVEAIHEHSWHTRVFLKGFKGHFNSVWFKELHNG